MNAEGKRRTAPEKELHELKEPSKNKEIRNFNQEIKRNKKQERICKSKGPLMDDKTGKLNSFA